MRSGSTEDWEPIYFELDTGKVEQGFNEIEAKITDLNSGPQIAKSAMFLLGENVRELSKEDREREALEDMQNRLRERRNERIRDD